MGRSGDARETHRSPPCHPRSAACGLRARRRTGRTEPEAVLRSPPAGLPVGHGGLRRGDVQRARAEAAPLCTLTYPSLPGRISVVGRIRRAIDVDGRTFWTMFDTGARNTYVGPSVAHLLSTSPSE
jgi:hypothetical protein